MHNQSFTNYKVIDTGYTGLKKFEKLGTKNLFLIKRYDFTVEYFILFCHLPFQKNLA